MTTEVAPGTKLTPYGSRLFGVQDLTEDELAQIFEDYHLPDARLRARWAKRAFWNHRATDPVLLADMFIRSGVMRGRQEALDVLGAMRARVIAKDAGNV